MFAILDSALMAHVAYVIDGQPFVTPTAFWREGETLYWHGSRASRTIEAHAKGADVCVNVARLEALVLGRTGFSHSVAYQSATCFGRTSLIDDHDGKAAAMNAFIDRIYPGRAATLRPYTPAELAQISVIAMPIEEAAGKVREPGVNEREPDFAFPAWAGVIVLGTRATGVMPDVRTGKEPPAPDVVARYLAAESFPAALAGNAAG